MREDFFAVSRLVPVDESFDGSRVHRGTKLADHVSDLGAIEVEWSEIRLGQIVFWACKHLKQQERSAAGRRSNAEQRTYE